MLISCIFGEDIEVLGRGEAIDTSPHFGRGILWLKEMIRP